MSLESSISGASAALQSDKAGERKKNAEALKSFLCGNAAPSLLTENSLKRSGFCWDDLFDDVNNLILKECEKCETSRTFDSVRNLCTSLLHAVISGANKGKAFIKWDRITGACLLILGRQKLIKAFGNAYLNLLLKYFLPYEQYLCLISPETWEELLLTCVTISSTNNGCVDNLTNLRVIMLIVNKGVNYCHFVIPMRDAVPKLKSNYVQTIADKKYQDTLLSIAVQLLETLSSESRLLMCEFTEETIPVLLRFYDSGDKKKKSLLFNFLSLSISLHHPLGRLQHEKGSLACSWDVWKRCLYSMLDVVTIEAQFLVKSNSESKFRFQNDDGFDMCPHFTKLAASLYFQIFNIRVLKEDDCGESSSKKARLNVNKNAFFNDLIQELREQPLPWISIISLYMNTYGATITITDYLALLSTLENLITSSNPKVNWDDFQMAVCYVLKHLALLSNMQEQIKAATSSLWSSCVRFSSTASKGHTILHSILRLLINLNMVDGKNVALLLKLYNESSMPVTNDSVSTLNTLLCKHACKFNDCNIRLKYLLWLQQKEMHLLDNSLIKECCLHLISKDSITIIPQIRSNIQKDILYDALFLSIERNILFSDFELSLWQEEQAIVTTETEQQQIEIHSRIERNITYYLENNLRKEIDALKKGSVLTVQYVKSLQLALSYYDTLLKYCIVQQSQLSEGCFCELLKESLQLLYVEMSPYVNKDLGVSTKIEVLQAVLLIFLTEYQEKVNKDIRVSTDEGFFRALYEVVKSADSIMEVEENDLIESQQSELGSVDLKCVVLEVLAAYCRKCGQYREDILGMILDPDLYDFSISKDVETALNCIKVLSHFETEEKPIDLIFRLMQFMCRALFRNTAASEKLLYVLFTMLEDIANQPVETSKNNCIIMIRGYLQRCETLYYPPSLTALVYKCISKIENMDDVQAWVNPFPDTLIKGIKSNIHSLRLYSSYLMKSAVKSMSDGAFEDFMNSLNNIFQVEVSQQSDTSLKDESANRTSTVLHCLCAVALVRPVWLHISVVAILDTYKSKTLDQEHVGKVLSLLINAVTCKSREEFLHNNILPILKFWFKKKHSFKDMPYHFFGCETMEDFLEKYMDWLVPVEVLCNKGGNIGSSSIIPIAVISLKISEEVVLDICFCNIMALSVPFVVYDKYHMQSTRWVKNIEMCRNAQKLFSTTVQKIGDDKFCTLFKNNIKDLILAATNFVHDQHELKDKFKWNTTVSPRAYCYPKSIYDKILAFYGERIEGNMMEYLCKKSPSTVAALVLQLWSYVVDENIFETKVLYLHRYITFCENIPFGCCLDSYMSNFMCHSLLQSLLESVANKNELVGVFSKALHSFLARVLPNHYQIVEKNIPPILSSLLIAREETKNEEVTELLKFLLKDMNDCLKKSIDLVDGASAFSQGGQHDSNISSDNFSVSLKGYLSKLSCFSLDILCNLRKLLKENRNELHLQCKTLSSLKGFSEDCKQSLIHNIINELCKIVTTSCDEKCILEACNCLGEIGVCDLKTLVMVPPKEPKQISDVNPSQYFALVVVESVSQLLFGDKPNVIKSATAAVKSILTFREGVTAMDLGNVDRLNLLPFASSSKNNAVAKHIIDDQKFDSTINLHNLWVPKDDQSHLDWLTELTLALLNVFLQSNNYVASLVPLCRAKPSVCQKLLPPLMGLILQCATDVQIEAISMEVKHFFEYFLRNTFNSMQDSEENLETYESKCLINKHKISIKCMLEVVDFIRLQRLHYRKRARDLSDTYNYLKLDYQAVAWAACVTDNYIAAIYYGELWCASQNNGIPPASPGATARLVEGENIQSIFRKSYISIGELSAISGCGLGHLLNEDEKRGHLVRMGHLSDALLMHDVALSNPTDGLEIPLYTLQRGVAKSLLSSGLYHIAVQYLKSVPEDNDLNDIKYECYCNLGDWSLFVDKSDLELENENSYSNLQSTVKAYQYACLKSCLTMLTSEGSEARLQVPLQRVKIVISKLIKKSNLENCESVYNVNSKLQIFNEIEEFYAVRCKKESVSEIVNKWSMCNLIPFKDFKHVEPILSQRSLMLEHAAQLNNSSLKDIVNLQLNYAELALANGRRQMSERLIAVAKRLQPGGTVSLVEGQVSWANGHKEIALSLMKNLMQDTQSSDKMLKANALRQYGNWMMESKYESARDVLDKYLKPSLEALGPNGHTDTRLTIYLDIAKFADSEYKQVATYMKSSIFENKVKCMENMKGVANSLKIQIQSQQSVSKDERRAMFTNERMSNLDEAEITSTYTEKKRFLDLAMRYYLLTLSQGELNDLSVFRVISLWFDNPTLEFDQDEGFTFEQMLNAVPSQKFLPVLPQLAPRLTMEKSLFSSLLKKIIERCALDHPHHTLPILFALSNSHKDTMILNASAGRGTSLGGGRRSGGGDVKEEPRVIAARSMLASLTAGEEYLSGIIEQMDQMCNAMISLANYKAKDKQMKQSIPRAEPLTKLKNCNYVAMPTIDLPVSKDCIYGDFISVVSFAETFDLVGGINAPKKMNCRGSDGIDRPILIKGEDDLRQDAVMQQVFTIVNTLLATNRDTSNEKLLIRTYKVVPLSRRSGVLEWCVGTEPLGHYLVGVAGNGGAHAKYRPMDVSSSAARAKLANCSEKGKTNAVKLAVFLKILSEFKPVFHHFFTEHFPAPVTWYERRLAYTKSVATSSMVGYMLGLGDRHVQNILIDKNTAEVIHIDFGIAFDQGKALPTPEIVPFRLTQDMVAGFGSSGVEGVFRRSCEKTLQLLRDNQETLLTILEVLLCDPLYSWSISPAQAKRKQNIPATPRETSAQGVVETGGGAAGRGGGPAERALLAVGSKLCGAEGGAGGVAVPGQVARLLQHATDPANLCRHFAGWQPYL